jgi:endonuclease YncB( thermonuclease family)
MSSVPVFLGGALLAASVMVAIGGTDPQSDFAPVGVRLAAAAFDGPVKARVFRVLDGDTFEARAAIWLGQSIEVRVRIAGIDAPELHGRCEAERRRGEAARNWLTRRIEGSQVKLSNVRYDKYGGRVDASVRDAKGDVGADLIAAGLARAYRGGRRGGWCEAAS